MNEAVPIERAYLICTTPRSGSNFLCEVLRSTGVAGQPDEYFWNPQFWRAQWGVTEFQSYFRRLLREGTSANGVFGSKLTWEQLTGVVAQLGELLGLTGVNPHDVLTASFPGLHYVWLTRDDKVRQAISFYRALETRRWRSTDMPAAAGAEPAFNFEAIHKLVQLSAGEDQEWRAFFAHYAIQPLIVRYEDLAQAPVEVSRRVLRHLGIPPTVQLSVPGWQHQRQADVLTEEWVARYRARRAD